MVEFCMSYYYENNKFVLAEIIIGNSKETYILNKLSNFTPTTKLNLSVTQIIDSVKNVNYPNREYSMIRSHSIDDDALSFANFISTKVSKINLNPISMEKLYEVLSSFGEEKL